MTKFEAKYLGIDIEEGRHVINITCPNCGHAHYSSLLQLKRNTWELKCAMCGHEWGQEDIFSKDGDLFVYNKK